MMSLNALLFIEKLQNLPSAGCSFAFQTTYCPRQLWAPPPRSPIMNSWLHQYKDEILSLSVVIKKFSACMFYIVSTTKNSP